MNRILTVISLILSLTACNPTENDVIWNSPSTDASGSMPIGNGEVGANVWVEDNGDIVFYISRSDSWSEIGELFKLGRVRVSLTPSLTDGNDFTQILDINKGRIRISGNGTALDFFIDSDSNTIYLTGKAGKPVDIRVSAEVWRDKEYEITPELAQKLYRNISGFTEGQAHFKAYPDKIASGAKDITVFHHNCESLYEATLQLQKIEIDNRASYDPIIDRCFGYSITMNGAERVSDLEMKASDIRKIDIKIATLTDIFKGGEGWIEGVKAASDAAPSAKVALKRTAKYWKNYWSKSYIKVQTPDVVTGDKINRAYVLSKWMIACSGRGNYPIKFNGSIFTVDPKFTDAQKDFNPDYRLWGGDFWWQNTRHLYHHMLKSGDYDMMKPLFEHYFSNLEMMKASARALCGAEGAISPETKTIFGTFNPTDFEWDRSKAEDNMPLNQYVKYYWSSSLEMVALMLDFWDYTGNEEFAETRLVPYAREMLTFYDRFFKRGPDGRLEIAPTHSIETYWKDVLNDTPNVSGLWDVTSRLQRLPERLSTEDDKILWKRLWDCLPAVPVGEVNGKTEFLHAEKYSDGRTNFENPNLYPVFPFHLCNISTDNLQTGINSYMTRFERRDFCWSQDGQQAARLGLADEAAENLVGKTGNANKNFRFPAIWGPNCDWTPDMDHAGNLILTLQEMVLQTYDGVDYILPAFPEDWGVRYKLYSFGGRVVKGCKKMPSSTR